MKAYPLHLKEHLFELLPNKSLFWPAKKTLILSDLHLGKAAHFRKHGVSIPQESGMKDLVVLQTLLNKYQPERLLILGDLFHSDYNADWEHFGELRRQFSHIRFELVPGNHDILQKHQYDRNGVTFLPSILKEEDFVFSHIPFQVEEHLLNISGHIHPGFYMEGKGRNSVSLPCFYFHGQTLLLPAFGRLTGLCMMSRQPKAEIFVVTGTSVHKV